MQSDGGTEYQRLGLMIVDALNRALPSGYEVKVVDDDIKLISPDGSQASWQGRPSLGEEVLLESEIVDMVISTLSAIQGVVAEETIEPWPARSGPGYGGFPEPHAEIRHDVLRAWFGDQRAPVLELGAFDITGGDVLRDD